jgi:uncharacterized cysteine cluster protein YcgN (CxxCxxCC family)
MDYTITGLARRGKPTDCRANWFWQDCDYRADRKGCNGFYWHTGLDGDARQRAAGARVRMGC